MSESESVEFEKHLELQRSQAEEKALKLIDEINPKMQTFVETMRYAIWVQASFAIFYGTIKGEDLSDKFFEGGAMLALLVAFRGLSHSFLASLNDEQLLRSKISKLRYLVNSAGAERVRAAIEKKAISLAQRIRDVIPELCEDQESAESDEL